jgi:tripartite-type tricarboxylate transporter receptor subunit TctC
MLAAIAASVALTCGSVAAQDAYPSKAVRMIIPFAPGGPADVIARLVAQKLSEDLGKQFYVENHAGAGGNTGAGLAARAPADGYSLLVTSQALVINASLYKSLPYDTFKDFIAVTRIATTPNVLVVNPSVPARTVKELVDLMKKEPDKYHSYAQPGIGTPSHLSGELFKLSQKLNLTAIPFGGGGPMVQSIVAGHTPVAFSSMPPAAPLIQAGKMRALAITAEKRLESVPDVPTMQEAGVKGYEAVSWYGMFAPAGTASNTISKINTDVVRAVQSADVKQRFAAIGVEPIGSTPEHLAKYLRAEITKWAQVVKATGMRSE